ncbi:MAG: Kazal-type serine protease inhibitor [Pseudomonadota bacterium]
MKTSSSLFVLLLALLLTAGCARETRTADEGPCINPKLADPERMCTMEYAPVCGCNDVTYSNACAAGSAGVTRFTQGACDASG